MLYSIGHSNIVIEKFIQILKNYDIASLYDSRGIPYSKYATQFNIENLSSELLKNQIEYIHCKALNGLDTKQNNSPTKIMAEHLNQIISASKTKNVVLMGANASYKDCHRHKLCNWIVDMEKSNNNSQIEIKHILLDNTNILHSYYATQINLF